MNSFYFRSTAARKIDTAAYVIAILSVVFALLNFMSTYMTLDQLSHFQVVSADKGLPEVLTLVFSSGLIIVIGIFIKTILSGYAVIVERNYRQILENEKAEEE